MSESPTLVAQNAPPPRSTAPSLVPDEWGGSDLDNPEWSRLDFQAARANVQLIRQVVQSRGGDPDETGALVGGALRQLADRAPFGHVGNAFLYGATEVLLERANAMSPGDFNQYLRTLDHRQNPINLFERTPLDRLTDDAKQATVRHIQETGGQQSFRLFGAMEGQNGPLAFSAGAADAVAENYGRGARDLLTIAANPLEAGRQFTNLATSVDRLPQAVQEAYRQLQTEIGRWNESDYRKGYISGQAVITAIDVRDAAESVGRLGALAAEMRAGRIHGIADAMEVLEHGRPRNRTDGEAPSSSRPGREPELSPGARNRVPEAPPAVDPVATPGGRQRLPDADQARLISNAFGFQGALARELDGEILRWAQGRPGNAIENLRSSPELLYGRGNGDIGLIGNAYLRAADIPDADLPAARRALGDIRDAMGGRSGADYARLYDDLMVPGSQSRRYFDGLVDQARGEISIEGIRDRSVANAVVIDAAGQPQQVFATARRPETVELQSGDARYVAEIRTATVAGGQRYVGWGTNDRWYPFQDGDRVFNADGSLNRERAAQAIMNDLNTGSAQRDALLPYDAWQQRRIEEQRLGSVGNAVVIDGNGDPRRIVATAGSGEAVEIVGADRQRRMIEIRDGQTADGQRYLGFGTNDQWYPFPGDRGITRPDGSLDAQAAREYITAQARAGNINRAAMVPGDQWDATHGRIGNDGLDQALQPVPAGAPRDRVQQAPSPEPRGEAHPPPQTPPSDRTPPTDPPQAPPRQQGTPPPDDPGRTPSGDPDRGQPQLPPSSQPNDPLLPFHAIEREQRMRAPEPLVAPGGQRFDVMGVDEAGRLRLRPEGQRADALPAEAMFEMRPSTPQTLAQPGNAVTYEREPWLTAGRNEQGIVLRDPQNAERTVVVPDARAAEIATPVGREVTYQGETWRFQALQSPGWQPGVERRGFQLVDPGNPERTVFVPENRAVDIRMRLGEDGDYRFGDVRHGVIRLNPMDGGREITMPLAPGMTFEARLRDRELEGPYRITVGNDGELTATGRIRNGNEVTQRIEPSDIAPRYVEVRSPDFNDRFEVDSFVAREANLRNRAIATEPTGLPLRDPAFGNLDGTPGPQLALGAQSLETQADFIRRNAGNLAPGQTPSLTVFNIAFSNEGEARQVLDAMSEFRRMHGDAAQIRIVAYEPSFRSFEGTPAFRELQEVIRRDRIEVDFFGNDPSQREVIHAKGVAVNDQVLFSTGAVIDASRNKADISVQLPPDAARAFNAYLDEAVIGNAGVDRRQQLAADAAREGVLVNDPEARLPYIARAQDGLIRGAERELTVSVSELRNPDTTRAIIERAEAGVNVQVQFREMDPESRRLFAEAQPRLPNLSVEDVSAWQPRPHYNVIVADRAQAYVGTAYLWQNQQDMLQHGRSFENGVLLQGEAVQRLQAQMEALRALQPAHPGQRLLNPAADDAPDVGVRVRNQTTGSISISAPAGSSIGVDVRDSATGPIQTVSGSGNVQVSGDRETLGTAATTAPDRNGNVQVTDTPGLRIELQQPGGSGRGGTDVRIDNSTVNGGVQSIVGNDNVQVNVNDARVRGENRQTAVGDDNRQTQNLGGNVTTGGITQTIEGRSGARQQIGDDLPPPRPADAGAGDRVVAQTADQRNLLQRTWDRVLDTPLPGIANLSVYAQQSGPDAKWQASLPVPAAEAIRTLQTYMANNVRGDAQASVDDFLRPAGAAVERLQTYMANNARGDAQASVDDFLARIDPRRIADVKVGPPSGLAGGVDFVTGVQRVQSLKIEIDGANVQGGGLRWDAQVGAYQLDVAADAGGYVLKGPLTVTPGESVTPLNVSGTRLTGPAADAVDAPGVSVRMSDEYGAITLPAGTRLSAGNVGLLNDVLANPEYRSRAGEAQYAASAKANYVVSEPRADADARDNVFNRIFAGEYGALESPKQKLEVSLSPSLLGLQVANPPLYGTRVGFELERVQGPTIRELVDGLREGVAPREPSPAAPGSGTAPPGDSPRSALPPGPPQPGDAAFAAYAQSRGAVERLNAGLNLGYGEPSEKLTVAAATVAIEQRLRVDEVALNPPSATLAGGTTAFVIERGSNRESDRYGAVPMQVAMQTPLDQGYQRLGEAAAQQQAQAIAPPSPQQAQELREAPRRQA